MHEIIAKKGKHRVDPKHPESTDATYDKAYRVGQKRIRDGKLKFEDKYQEQWYWKAIRSNPGNVPGGSVFFPPLMIRTTVPILPWKELEEMSGEEQADFAERKFKEKSAESRDTELWCETCEKLTSHAISYAGSYCHACGNVGKFRLPSPALTLGELGGP